MDMELNKKELNDEALKMISGADDDDIVLVDENSPCPCGGSHVWIFSGVQTLIGQYYYCDKCGQWLEKHF